VIRLAGGTVEQHNMIVGGSSEAPPVVVDLDGDGANELIAAVRRTNAGEEAIPGLYIANWEILNQTILPPDDPANLGEFCIVRGGPFSSPVAVDLDRNGSPEVMLADTTGAFHAFHFTFSSHIEGDPPVGYITASELPGWPARFPGTTEGRAAEISVADLEQDGYADLFQTGEDSRVAALYWSGSPRSGYPLKAGTPLVPADSAGSWAPIIADVDGDGVKDVVPILPDGRRVAYRANGAPIGGFAELGSTGLSAPPILADLDGDGVAEWVETFDASSQLQINVKAPILPVQATSVAWGQYRLFPTRNAVVILGSAPPQSGTPVVTDVYVYPNPSKDGSSRIHYRLSSAATSVSIRVYDTSGSLIADLPTGSADLLGSSEHAVVWNNRSIASGVYVCRVEVQSGGRSEVRFATSAILR